MESDFRHTTVLLQEAVDYLNVQSGKWYVDATSGGGGHTQEIITRGGKVIAIDQDGVAITHLMSRFKNSSDVRVVRGNFSDITFICREAGVKVNGFIFDLGVSSYQIDESGRGFSFMRDEELDMRMDERSDITAQTIVNTWGEENLYELFTTYGEEPFAKQIITDIFRARRIKPIKTTGELVDIIKKVSKEKRIHPATRVFQALRIAVNNELGVLEKALSESLGIMEPKGRIVIISFHSLEDRIAKRFIEKSEKEGRGRAITRKPLSPGAGEVSRNRRSRSAKMRVFEKI